LEEALELTVLIARKDPRRHPRVAARWMRRYLEEYEKETIDELAMVAGCLAALGGEGHEEAAETVRAMVARRELRK
jgi:NTP pyrophosphatase (non-canonical NTP hydrolase)